MGAIKNKAIEIAIKQGLEKVQEDPDKNLPKLVEIVKKFDKDNMWESKYQFLEKVTKDRDNNWNQYIRNIMEDIDDDIIEKFLCNFIVNSAIKGISRNHEVKEKEGCGAPWAIVMDPTTVSTTYPKKLPKIKIQNNFKKKSKLFLSFSYLTTPIINFVYCSKKILTKY